MGKFGRKSDKSRLDVAASLNWSRKVETVWRSPDRGDWPLVGGTWEVASERGIGEKCLRLRTGDVEPGSQRDLLRAGREAALRGAMIRFPRKLPPLEPLASRFAGPQESGFGFHGRFKVVSSPPRSSTDHENTSGERGNSGTSGGPSRPEVHGVRAEVAGQDAIVEGTAP